MIAYDLRCCHGHQFETWFKNLKAFELQRKRGFIECPRCGSTDISLVYSASTIRGRSLSRGSAQGPSSLTVRLGKFLEENFEDVGSNFPEEARRAYYGEAEPRNIRGETTPSEEEDLREEGIPFVTIALPKPSH